MVISSLKDCPKISEKRFLDFTLGFMVMMLFFMEKQRWNRRPWVFP
jgi:hypothetical protein